MKVLDRIREKLKLESSSGLKAKGINAAFWSIIGKGSGSFLRLISNIILTSILAPEIFGIMSTCFVFLTMIQLFSDVGLKPAIIQSKEGDSPEYLNTAWVISIIRSFGLFIIVLIAIYPISIFYQNESLQLILFCLSFTILISGFENPAMPLLVKNLRADRQVRFELSTEFLGLATNVILALLLRNIWALVLGSILTSSYKLIGSYVAISYYPKFTWNKVAAHSLIRFGKFILLNTMAGWAAMNLDSIFIGKLLDMEYAGVYNVGKNLGLFVELFFVQIFTQSYFPAVSSVSDDLPRVEKIYKRTIALAITISVTVLSLEMIYSEQIISLLYRKEYNVASIVFFWISLRGIFRMVSIVQSSTLIALGRPGLETIAMFVGFIFVALLFPGSVLFSKSILIQFPYLNDFIKKESALTLGVMAICFSGIMISLIESFYLVLKINFKLKIIILPWLHLICLLTGIYCIYKIISLLNIYYWILEAGIVALFSILFSLLIYIGLEGKNPFENRSGATKPI